MTDPGVGVDVVPFQGVQVMDDFLHRIFWRVYALKDKLPQHIIANGWSSGHVRTPNKEGISEFLESNGLTGKDADESVGSRAEFLTVAVKKAPAPPMQPAASAQQ